MKFFDYYKNYSTNQYIQKNIPEVKLAASNLLKDKNSKDSKWLLIKVNNHIKRTGIEFSINEILQGIKDNDLIASNFCKSAAKQNSSELCQLEFIKKYKNILLENLPAAGVDTWRFVLGTGEFIQTKKIEEETSHSFDFRYTSKYDYFIMAKVTTTQGGGQNHQRKEMLEIINECELYVKKYPNSNKRFILLLDGDNYYGDGTLAFTEKLKSKDKIFIMSSDNFNIK